MVDIPEQAVKAAEEAVYLRHERGFLIKPLIDPIDMRAALTAAAPYMSGVDVKRLRWREKDSGAYAHCAVGYYEIKETRLGFCVYHNKFLVSKDMFETLEAAKVAAQDNLERRLLVCLSVKPVDVAAVREQALEEAAQNAECHSDDRARRYSMDWNDGYIDGCKGAAAAIRALKSNPVSDGWQPIERAPKDGTEILGWHKVAGPSQTRFYDGEWCCVDWNEDHYISCTWKPTHWRPLPTAPTSEVGK